MMTPPTAAWAGRSFLRRTGQAPDQQLLDAGPEPEALDPFRLGQPGQFVRLPDAGQGLLAPPALEFAMGGLAVAVRRPVEQVRPTGQVGAQPVERLLPP